MRQKKQKRKRKNTKQKETKKNRDATPSTWAEPKARAGGAEILVDSRLTTRERWFTKKKKIHREKKNLIPFLPSSSSTLLHAGCFLQGLQLCLRLGQGWYRPLPPSPCVFGAMRSTVSFFGGFDLRPRSRSFLAEGAGYGAEECRHLRALARPGPAPLPGQSGKTRWSPVKFHFILRIRDV